MKKTAIVLVMTSLLFLIISCRKDETKKGTATFGANYNVINCITNVTVYIDGECIGKLKSYTAGITDCGQPENLTTDLPEGQHSFKVEIRPMSGTGCTKDISGTIMINKNECTKVFIDFFTIDF
jgi:hypothetical protein